MTEQAAPSQEAPSFAIEKLYVKDLSLEVPNAPEIYLERDAPEVNIQLQNVPEENLQPPLSIACPNILFPYSRELISESITRAGFSPVILQPVNFEALFAARAQQEQAAAAAGTAGVETIQ